MVKRQDLNKLLTWLMALCAGVCVAGCAMPEVLAETPMSTTCSEVPTVEECRTAAETIEDDCLRECILLQCSSVKVDCSERIQQKCKELSEKRDSEVGGYVERQSQTCQQPVDEIGWCQLPMSRKCRAKTMVHELAHSCGWSHGNGNEVPGNGSSLQCKWELGRGGRR